MKIEVRISGTQLTALIIGIILGTVFLTLPQLSIKGAQNDAWAAVGVAYLLGLPFALLTIKVLLAFDNKDIFEINQELLGNFLGNLINIIFTLNALYFTALQLRIPGLFFSAIILPETPAIVFGLFMLILTVFTLKQGFEVLARFIEFSLSIVIISIIVLLLLATPMLELSHLQPVLKRGIEPILIGTKENLGVNLKYILLLGIVVPFVNKRKESYGSTVKGLATGATVLVLTTVMVIGVFGGNDPARFFWPTFQLAKVIEIGGFIHGIEAMLVGVWSISSFIEIALFFFVTVRGIRHIFQLESLAGVYWTLAMIVGALSMYPHGVFDFQEEIYFLDKYVITPLVTITPVILSIILLIKGRSKEDGNSKIKSSHKKILQDTN